MTASNPLLLTEWETPFGMPPFELIEDEHFMPAFEQAMATHLQEIEAIAQNSEPPSFANTMEAMERAGGTLLRVNDVFWNLVSTEANDERQKIEREISPVLAKHYMSVVTNKALFARIEALARNAAALDLTPEQERLLESNYRYFVRAGGKLDADGKARATAITARLAELYTAFSQNVLSEEKSYQLVLESEEDLAGLPPFLRDAAKKSAADRGLDGKYAITLSRASIEPFLQFSSRRDLREKVYNAYIARGQMASASDNRPIVDEILALRTERAKLLGFETYADFSLDDAMAKTPAAARQLLDNVWRHAKPKALEEQRALEALARAAGLNEPLAAWDWHYYSEKRRKGEFEIDSAVLKPYFQLDNMIAAAFDTARRLFGLTFKERRDVPVYHPDVRVWEVTGRDAETIGLFFGDYFQRPSKRGNAWMSSLRRQQKLDGKVLPAILNVMNFSKAADGAPSLLSPDDAETLFHEFGHGLHGLLSDVTYASLSGPNVDRDFVELPSQLFENWLFQPSTLNRFARHVETGEPIPKILAEKIIGGQKFNQGFATVEYTASALLDLDLHALQAPGALDVNAFEESVRARLGVPATISLRHRPAHFQHIFAGEGYSAGYYTYMWAEVMEADAFQAFEEAGDIFDPETADRLRKFIYSSGGSMKPDEAYRAFRGHEPKVHALMEKRGLIPEKAAA